MPLLASATAAGPGAGARQDAGAAAGAARPGVPFQLVHHDDVAAALRRRDRGHGEPGAYNLAGAGEMTVGDVAHEMGWQSVRVPGPPGFSRRPLPRRRLASSPRLKWAVAYDRPVLMDATKARGRAGMDAGVRCGGDVGSDGDWGEGIRWCWTRN